MAYKKTYSELLKDPRWQKKRLTILDRDKFKCTYCGDGTSELHVHHKKYLTGKKPWEYNKDMLTTLCGDCHKGIHRKEKIIELFVNYSDVQINRMLDFITNIDNDFNVLEINGAVSFYIKNNGLESDKRDIMTGFDDIMKKLEED